MPERMRPRLVFPFLLLGLACFGAAAAFAAGNEAVRDGVTLRLAVERPDATGRLRAALLIDLAPGWKTYWLDPGEAGLPPAIAATRSEGVVLNPPRFPAPHRWSDGVSVSTVYSEPFAVGLDGRLAAPPAGVAPRLALDVTLGLCREVCVPVTARLEAGPGDDAAAVPAAFAALPRRSTATIGIVGAALSADGGFLEIAVTPAALAAEADLFASGGRGWGFGPPAQTVAGDATATIRLPVLSRPRKSPDGPLAVDAILVSPAGTFAADALPVAPLTPND